VIAAVIKGVRDHHAADETTIELLVESFIEELENENPNFDAKRFRLATGEG